MEGIKNLTDENNRSFYINCSYLNELKTELEEFLKDISYMKNISFSKRVMYPLEIKTNNTIEGYFEDVTMIEDVIKSNDLKEEEKNKRIRNLYNGYNYILNKESINKDNLNKLYYILSNGLLSSSDIKHMGSCYRNDDVYIYYSDNTVIAPDKGINSCLLDEKMDSLLSFINDYNDFDTMTDYYIKSQIAHFYFVYLHPYFDLNGRTSRTVAMWYLLNNKAYPYTIFNRAIINTKNTYYKEIRKVKRTYNLTSFIRYLMLNTKLELEKEYVIQVIKDTSKKEITNRDVSTLLNILSMNGLKTLKDFTYIYNLKNTKKRVDVVYNTMIEPLLDKEVINFVRYTDTKYNSIDNNFVFELNSKNLDIDPKKIRRLKL